MATYTKNLKLKKPHQDDYYNINDFNENMDIIDGLLSGGISNSENSSSDSSSASSEEVELLKQEIAGLKEIIKTLATKDEVEEKAKEEVARIVGTAPESLDTLEEVAEAIKDNEDLMAALNSAIGNKVDVSDFEDFVNAIEEIFGYIYVNIFGSADESVVNGIYESYGGLYNWVLYLMQEIS